MLMASSPGADAPQSPSVAPNELVIGTPNAVSMAWRAPDVSGSLDAPTARGAIVRRPSVRSAASWVRIVG
jgi:hypothetical protein